MPFATWRPTARRGAQLALSGALALLIAGCASGPRQLMPTPVIYHQPGGRPLFEPVGDAAAARPRGAPDLDLLFITNRAPQQVPDDPLPYGEVRSRSLAFGSATVRLLPAIDWPTLKAQSQVAERTREINLELGRVTEQARFPQEPYTVSRAADGALVRDQAELAIHDAVKGQLQGEVQRRFDGLPRREVLLYVHGFNETFESAAFTTAELCHFLGREHVCAFFTWPASASGNFLTAYTTTTETAEFAVDHLKKTIRMLATTPGVERVHLLAHSRGAALMLKATRELALEAIASGKDSADLYRIGNLVLLSPDIDVDIAGQYITGFMSDPDLTTVWPRGVVPRSFSGRLTVYSSPEDRALLVSRILFRSRNRVGQLRPEDIPEKNQRYLANLGRMDLVAYEGKRTDFFGHSYFTSNPDVSADLIAMIRYGIPPGEPGRPLIRTGPITWRFPTQSTRAE